MLLPAPALLLHCVFSFLAIRYLLSQVPSILLGVSYLLRVIHLSALVFSQVLPNGNYAVGVHIADVATFVAAGTAIDQEASERATSVYLVARRIDMLPKPLTEDICSLRSQVERFAFSVLWEIDPLTYEVVDTSFTRSVIKSRAALSYVEAQARMDDDRVNDEVC